MPAIPAFTSTEQYGFTPQPQDDPGAESRAPQALAAGAGQVANASMDLGGRISELFADQQARQQRTQQMVDASGHETNFALGVAKLRLDSLKNPDYMGATQAFLDQAQALKQSTLAGIQDPQVRAFVSQSADKHITTNGIAVQADAMKNGNAAQMSSIGGDIDKLVQGAAGAANAGDLALAIDGIKARAQGGVASQLYTPLQAQTMTSTAVREAITLRSLTDPAGAQSIMGQYGSLMTARDHVLAAEHLQPRLNRLNGDAHGETAFNLATGGAGAPTNLVGVVHQLESGGSMAPGISGDGGAAFGPMQVHGGALADVNAKLGTSWTLDQIKADPQLGRKAGEVYLGIMRDKYGRDDYALGAYNQGPGAMDAAIKSGRGVAGLPGGGPGYVAKGLALLGRNANQPTGGSDPIVIGDSIARGIGDTNKLRTDAEVGLQPDAILDKINAIPADGLRGQSIVLSSGISNDPSKLDVVQQQIDSLKARGVTDIRLMGVGSRADLAPLNDRLAALAQKNGATFVPIKAGPDGVHPSSYKGLAVDAGDAKAASGPTAPDDEAAMTYISQIQDPAEQQRAMTRYQQLKHQWNAAHAQERTALAARIKDVSAGLGAGLDIDPPAESDVRALYGSAQATEIMDNLRDLQRFSAIRRSVDLASPQDIAAARQQFTDDTGRQPKQQRGAGAVLAGNAPDAASGHPNVEGLAARLKEQNRYEAAIKQRDADLAADPATFVASRDPAVKPFADALQANPQDKAALEQYGQALLASQARLGVPASQQRILTDAQVHATADQLASMDPAKGDAGQILDGVAKQWGSLWPQVFGEMVEHGKLSRDYQVLAAMDQPGQVIGRQDFQRMLMYVAQKGGATRMMGDLPDGTQKELKNSIGSTMENFLQTARFNGPGGLRLFDDLKDSVMHLAAYRMATRAETNSSAALTNAYNDVIGQKYDILDTMRVPKMFEGKPVGMDVARPAVRAALAGIKPEDLAPVTTGGVEGMTDADRRTAYARDVKSQGFWVANKDGSGLALMFPLRHSTEGQTVRRADGTPMQVLFRDMANGAAGIPPMAMSPSTDLSVSGP